MRKMMFLFLFLTFTILSLDAQENNASKQPIKIQLKWKYQFQFAGFIVAKEKGYYKELGLDVEILDYKSGNVIDDLEAGKVDYATSNGSLLFKDKKLKPLTLIATYLHRSPLVLATQTDIKSPNQLYNKTIMINENERLYSTLSLLFEYYGINPNNTNFIPQSYNSNDFISEKVDAFAAFRSNEIYLLKQKGVAFNIVDPADYGFTTSAINLFTTQQKVKRDPEEVRKIVEATNKGWEYAIDNLNEVAELIQKKYRPDLSLAHLQYEAKLTKELMLTNLFAIGDINKDFVYKTFTQLKKRSLIDQDEELKNAMLNFEEAYQNLLTVKEKQWIKYHPVVTYSEINWQPLSIIQDGEMDGVMGDYLDLIAQKTGLKFKFVPSKSWGEVLQKFQQHEIDLVPGIGSSPQELSLGLVSNIYDTYQMLIVTDKSYRYVDNLNDFKTKTIAVPKYYTSYNFISSKYPDIKIIPTQTIEEALELVEHSQADAFVGHAATALYYMAKVNPKNLQVSGNATFNFEHRYLVAKDNEILHSIINKTLANITDKEKSLIRAKWLRTTVNKEINYTAIMLVVFVSTLIILVLFYRHRVVSNYQKKAQKLNERIQLALDASKSGIWDWNPLSDEVYFSASWKKIIGYKDDEMQNSFEEWESRVHPDDIENTLQTLYQAKQAELKNFTTTFRMQHKDGHWVWISSIAKVYFNENNKVVKISGTSTDISAQKEAEDKLIEQKIELDHLAHHDPLTGLANRTLFNERLHSALEYAQQYKTKLALLFIDLDHFKEINDSLGHSIGDQFLKKVTARLQTTLKDYNSLARLGGDEFTVLMSDLGSIDEASKLATQILESLAQPIKLQENNFYISCSIGISIYPDDGLSAQNLLKYADAAMYRAKNEGRNNFQFYSADMTELAFERVIMESALREAIKKKEFVVYFQPQVDALTNKIIGLEALARWQHPTMGLIPPSKFIPLAESTGLIVELDQLIMQMAMNQMAQWRKAGLDAGKLSLNISVKQLHNKYFIADLKKMVEESGCSYDQIELEITESEVMTNPEDAIEILQQISQLGIHLSIDDFGTGYSSLAYLKRLPINKLKIDRSFVKDLPDDEEDKAITKTIIALGQNLNLDIIAEGIETEAQKDFVVQHGCKNIQGYFYYKPMTAAELQKVLKDSYV